MSAQSHRATDSYPDDTRADAAALAGQWRLDPAASQVAFHVRDKLVTTVHGTLPVLSGEAQLAEGGTVTSGTLVLSATGVDTGNARRDTDLRKARFLDAKASPTIRVELSAADPLPSGVWAAIGVVHARSQAAPVELSARTVAGADPRADRGLATDVVHVRVSGKLDRNPLQIKVPAVIIGRWITFEATLTYTRVKVT